MATSSGSCQVTAMSVKVTHHQAAVMWSATVPADAQFLRPTGTSGCLVVCTNLHQQWGTNERTECLGDKWVGWWSHIWRAAYASLDVTAKIMPCSHGSSGGLALVCDDRSILVEDCLNVESVFCIDGLVLMSMLPKDDRAGSMSSG